MDISKLSVDDLNNLKAEIDKQLAARVGAGDDR